MHEARVRPAARAAPHEVAPQPSEVELVQADVALRARWDIRPAPENINMSIVSPVAKNVPGYSTPLATRRPRSPCPPRPSLAARLFLFFLLTVM